LNLTGMVLGGRYEIAEKLGAGGMAIVYRAQDTLLQRPVTVKVLRGELVADENVVRRFRREAQAAASLSHPNIVGVYDVGRQDDIHYIVMEYVQGKTLKEEISERGPLPPEEAVRIARQICEALRHAHAHHIIHRDVKPHNVLITPEGRVKIGDFGIAGAATGSTVTYPGSMLGTVYYFSPEQAQGRYGDERSDLYALGVVLYEMLTGRVPFEGESPVSVALKHIREIPPSPRELNPRVPPLAERIVMKAMAKEGERRYQSAAEMLRDLETLQRQLADRRSGWAPPGPARSSLGPAGATADRDRDRTQVVAAATPGAVGAGAGPVGAGAGPESGEPGRRGPGGQGGAPAAGVSPETGEARGTEAEAGAAGPGLAPPGDYFDFEVGPAAGSGRRRWSRVALWLGSFAAFFVMVAVGLFFLVQWFEVPEVSVPNVVGLSVIDAQNRLEQYRLTARIVSYDYNAEVPSGQVVNQDPAAGVTVKANRTVSLWVSKGPELIAEVPDVVGLTWREAKINLEQAGFTVDEADFTYASSDTVAKDRVLDQEPKAGTRNLPRGTKAYLVISLGPASGTVVVPNFVGQTLENARALLPGLGLTEGTITYVASNQPDGTILGQDPAPGTGVPSGATVSFTVAGSGGSDTGSAGGGQQHTYRVSFTVPAGGPATQNVRIVVTDAQGQRVVYDHDHVAGYEGKVDVTYTGDSLSVQIYYAGNLAEQFTVTP